MSSGKSLPLPGGNTVVPAQQDQRRQLRVALLSLALPAFFVLGFALSYMSAFHAPTPHGVQVAVAGPAAQTAPVRDGLERTAGPAFAVQAVSTPAAAARAVSDHDLYGAYVPAAQPGGTATVIVAGASGTGVTNAVESLFRAVAAQQRAQLAVRDVRPLPAGNTSGLSLYFYLFACTLGGVLTVAATGMAAPALRPRYRWPVLLATAIATPTVAYLLAGQGLGAISGSAGAVFALLGVSVLYVLIITLIVRALQLSLGAIGALFTAMTMFIMLNFPSAGVSVQAPMLPTFWHVQNRFWIGASASDAFRSILYFGGQGAGTDVLKLLGWLAVGAVLLALVAFLPPAGKRGLAPQGAGCQQAEGPGAGDGLGPGVRAELAVQVADVGPDGVVREVQLAGDLGHGQVGGQVAQQPDLAIAQRLQRRLRPGRRRGERASGEQAEDVGDQGSVRGALWGLALEQVRHRVQ
jgi:hypothetical protein